MDIAKGFQIEQPLVFIPWGVPAEEIESLFSGAVLERCTGDGFLLDSCKGLGGLDLRLKFRFDRASGALCEIVLGSRKTGFKVRHSRNKMRHIPTEVLYDQLQAHLEATFGAPTASSPGDGSVEFPDHTWLFQGVRIEHCAGEHVGVAQAVITKMGEDEAPVPQRSLFARDLRATARRNVNARETLNLKIILTSMVREGSVEVFDGRGATPESGAKETQYRFVGTRAIYRLVELRSKKGGRWELVLPEYVRSSVQ